MPRQLFPFLLADALKGQSAWFTVLLAIAAINGLITWLLAVYYMLMTAINSKPTTGMFYGLIFSENLTEAGIKYRRRLFYSVLCFAIPGLVVMLIGLLTGQP